MSPAFSLYCDNVPVIQLRARCLILLQSLQRTSRNPGLLAWPGWLPELAQ